MIPFTVLDDTLHYLISTPDGRTRPTAVSDTPENRWYLNFAHRAPLAHQVRDVIRFRDAPYFALFYEQRARKTKVALEIFRYRFTKGDVDALIVVAYPNGVHRVWLDEVEKDFPEDFLATTKTLAWVSGKTDSKGQRDNALALRDHRGPLVATFNSEAVARSAHAYDYLVWLMKTRKTMLVADESAFMANFTAITRKMEALSRSTKERRGPVVKAILDGTPVEEGAGEIYHPTQFLSKGLLGYSTKVAFKARYFEYEEEDVEELAPVLDAGGRPEFDADGMALMAKTGRVFRQRVKRQRHGPGGKIMSEYEVFKGYRNLDELYRNLQAFSSRVRRVDVSDAPEKTYQTRYFDLTSVQRKVYNDLRDRYVAELDGGGRITAANVLLRMTRLQMVARNYYPPEKVGEVCPACDGVGFTGETEDCPTCDGIGIVVRVTDLKRIDTVNLAVEAVKAELIASRQPALIWCRFRQDVADVLDATRELGLTFFRYDGGVPEAQREADYRRFRDGEGDGIVATERSGLQRGHDCSRANLSIYYSNEYGLRHRRQSEDRTEGLDNLVSTQVVDLVAADTRDIVAIEALRAKRSIAEIIMGDPPSRWI